MAHALQVRVERGGTGHTNELRATERSQRGARDNESGEASTSSASRADTVVPPAAKSSHTSTAPVLDADADAKGRKKPEEKDRAKSKSKSRRLVLLCLSCVCKLRTLEACAGEPLHRGTLKFGTGTTLYLFTFYINK